MWTGEVRMKSECTSVSKLLDKYFDQEVTPEERSLVEGHLPNCSACQMALDSMQNLRLLIKGPVEEAVEKENFPWVWERIERGIQRKERLGLLDFLKSWLDVTPLLKRKILIPAVAAAVVLILITVPLLFKKTTSYPTLSVVEYVESETYNVMVYELESPQVTVIWLFEGPEEESSTS
jgi:predicted anti-sigma-YlaC factor YlaD